MKPESLHALVIDHHSGELPPEVTDLLAAYLAATPAARDEAGQISAALSLTRETVARHPELAHVSSRAAQVSRDLPRQWLMPVWMKAAAVLAFSALTTAGGFFAGRARPVDDERSPVLASVAANAPRKPSPWARYRLTPDPLGKGIQVVRVDGIKQEDRP